MEYHGTGLDLGATKVINGADPINPTDLATKEYVDAPTVTSQLAALALQSWSTTPVDVSANVQTIIDNAYNNAVNLGGAGGELQFPKGIFYGTFKMRRGVSIRGQGFATVFRAMPSQTASVLDYATYDAYHVRVSHCRVDGNNAGGAIVRGIDMTSSANDAKQGPPLTTTATNDHPAPYFTTWDNTDNMVDDVYVQDCSGDWAVYIGRNQRNCQVTRLLGEANQGGAMYIGCTDGQFHELNFGACSDGILIAGTTNKITNCKSWYHGVLANFNKATGPNSTTYFGDGYRLANSSGKGSYYGGNQLIGCESQDNINYGYRLTIARSDKITGCMSGGDTQGAVYAGGNPATNQVAYCEVDVNVDFADRTQENASLVLDYTSAYFCKFKIHTDIEQAINPGYVHVSFLNGATANTCELDLRYGGLSTVSLGNVSGAYALVLGQADIYVATITGNVTMSPVATKWANAQRRFTMVFKQNASWTVTWDASFINPPTMTQALNGYTVAEFVNISTTVTPVWVCITPGITGKTIWSATADFVNYHQTTVTARTGTFVASSTVMDVEVSIAATVLGYALANWYLYVGIITPAGNQLVPQTSSSVGNPTQAPTAGVTDFRPFSVGAHGYEGRSTLTWKTRMTGLTLGATYTYQLMEGAVDSAKITTVGTSPQSIAITQDGSKAYVVNNGSNNVTPVVISARPFWETLALPSVMRSMTPIPVGTGPVIAAAQENTNGVLVAVTNNTAKTVSIIDSSLNIVVGTYTLPNASGPYGCAWNPAGTVLYVACADGTVQTLTVPASGVAATWGAGTTISAGHSLVGIAVAADNSKLWVADNTANTVVPVTISGMAVGAGVAVGGAASSPWLIKRSGDGTFWVCCFNTGILQQFTNAGVLQTSIQTYNQTYVAANSTVPGTTPGQTAYTGLGSNGAGTINGIVDFCLSGDGTVIYWCSGRQAAYNWTATGTVYDKPQFGVAVYAMASTSDEYVLVSEVDGPPGHLFQWPSGTVYCRPTSTTANESMTISFEGAH